MQASEPWLESGRGRLVVALARTDADVRAAQRLRYEVFGGEMGARLRGAEPGLDADRFAARAWRALAARHLAPPDRRVVPRTRLPLARLDGGGPAELPPLVKGYLRLGAQVCGEPAWDPDFDTADVLVLLPMARVSARYARHYLGDTAVGAVFEAPAYDRPRHLR